MCDFMLQHIRVRENILDDARYDYLFTVEDVNRLVLQGVPFREAYRRVGEQVQAGTYRPTREVRHTHEGSIGNLCNDPHPRQDGARDGAVRVGRGAVGTRVRDFGNEESGEFQILKFAGFSFIFDVGIRSQPRRTLRTCIVVRPPPAVHRPLRASERRFGRPCA